MLISSITTNTWHCDGLDCPTDDQVAVVNPFYSMTVYLPSVPLGQSVEIDLCKTCMAKIDIPAVVAFATVYGESVP